MTAHNTQNQDALVAIGVSKGDALRLAIRTFLHRRRIEAMSAAAVIATASYSQAYALSLGELNIQSALGQPLRATLNIGVSPGETLSNNCVRVLPNANDGMPGVGSVSLSMSTSLNGATLAVAGSAPMREPMTEMVLSIDCAGTPTMTRTFLVLLDPPGSTTASLSASTATTSTAMVPTYGAPFGPATRSARPAPTEQTSTQSARRPASTRRNTTNPIEPGSRYVVQPGDILSVIASRVANRPDYTVWPIAQRIYDTNPNAFDSQTPDSLRVGATLDIPQLVGRLAVAGSPSQVRRVEPRRVAAVPSDKTRSTARATVKSVTRTARQPDGPTTPQASPVDTFAIEQDLSNLSMDRLRKRRTDPTSTTAETAAVLPPNVAISRREEAEDARAITTTTSAADAAPQSPGQDTTQAESAPAAKPAAPAVATPAPTPAPAVRYDARPVQRGLPGWLVAIAALIGAALGGAATLYGLRGWLATQRAEQERALARSKRHQERLEESRRQRPSSEAPAIVVHEQLPRVDIGAVAAGIESVGSVEEVIAAGPDASSISAILEADKKAEENTSEDTDPSLAVDALDNSEELDFDVFEAPDESALELLAQDYAQSDTELTPDPDATAMLTPEQLGITEEDTTQMLRGALDLELPEGSPDDTVMAVADVDALEAEIENELTEVAEQLNDDLLRAEQDQVGDNDPTAVAPVVPLAELDEDTDPTSAISTRDTEDYYHLEASSIRKVDMLSFEKDADDDDTRMVSSLK